MDKMTETPEMRKSALKWAYSWILIMLSVNLFYVGYAITERGDFNGLSESSLYNLFYNQMGTTQTNIQSINGTASSVAVSDINNQEEGVISYILDKLDGIFNYVKFISFIVTLLTFGGAFLGWDILSGNLIDSPFIKLGLTMFMVIGNLVFYVLIYRLVINKGRED